MKPRVKLPPRPVRGEELAGPVGRHEDAIEAYNAYQGIFTNRVDHDEVTLVGWQCEMQPDDRPTWNRVAEAAVGQKLPPDVYVRRAWWGRAGSPPYPADLPTLGSAAAFETRKRRNLIGIRVKNTPVFVSVAARVGPGRRQLSDHERLAYGLSGYDHPGGDPVMMWATAKTYADAFGAAHPDTRNPYPSAVRNIENWAAATLWFDRDIYASWPSLVAHLPAARAIVDRLRGKTEALGYRGRRARGSGT
jgi:hypothetical protein